jgi:hypothetical protein
MATSSATNWHFSTTRVNCTCECRTRTLAARMSTTLLNRPINQRSVMSLNMFMDILEYVNNMKKRSTSRPNSMASNGTKIDGRRVSPSENIVRRCSRLDLKSSLFGKTSSYVGAKSDQLLLAQTFIDVIGARLSAEVHTMTNDGGGPCVLVDVRLIRCCCFVARQSLSNVRNRHSRW